MACSGIESKQEKEREKSNQGSSFFSFWFLAERRARGGERGGHAWAKTPRAARRGEGKGKVKGTHTIRAR